MILRKLWQTIPIAALMLVAWTAETAVAQSDKPNILLIMSDDVGLANISAYSMGLVGYQTPNIDRIAKEGMLFTDYYAEQSCTAGRSAFITGIHPVRTGLTKVGLPGSSIGISPKDPTLAELLKPHGYVSGQFGKNHLGDRNEFLPTVHGFDEFFGNLYHLNAEEEPENEDYPKDPGVSRTVWSPRCTRHESIRSGRSDRRPAFRPRRQADHQGYRPAHAQAYGNGGRGVSGSYAEVHSQEPRSWQALDGLDEHIAHALLHAPEEGKPGRHGTGPLCGWHDGARRSCRSAARSCSMS